tara:strand:- start:257 stop:562 length:306 start_codon:yes stop_codon:yes gene_type:complete
MIASALKGVIGAGVEHFESKQQAERPGYSLPKSWISFVVFLILLFIIALFGQLIWNELIAGGPKVGNVVGNGFITIFKPLPSVWHAIALYIAMDIFFSSSA